MATPPIARERWQQLAAEYEHGLRDTLAFWERHSPDREHGGCFFYLDRTGQRYGDDKPVWLLGRAAWVFATAYTQVERRPEWLAFACNIWDFMTRHAFDADGKMYFLLDRVGQPLRMRRYVYSEVFAVMAAAALAEATGDEGYLRRAGKIFDRFDRAVRTPGQSVPKTNPDVRPMKGLAPLMCHLLLCDTLWHRTGDARYETLIDEVAAEVFHDFVRPDRRCVLETVGPHGEVVPGPDGRTMNPGHAIEAAWFLLEIARRRRDADLAQRAAAIIDWSFERGWDPTYGGLVYFVDVEGQPPTQLEHDMKLWWPHCEALYATLLATVVTGAERYAQWFEQTHAWTQAHFPDAEHGEWFGYLHRDGSLSTPLKGGMWKGSFHVARMQLMCWRLAQEMATH